MGTGFSPVKWKGHQRGVGISGYIMHYAVKYTHFVGHVASVFPYVATPRRGPNELSLLTL